MFLSREKLVPYGLAGAVATLIVTLVTADIWSNLPAAPNAPAEPAPEETPAGEVENFVLFREVPFKDTEVVTGRRYKTRFAQTPIRQWCYVMRRPGNGAERRFVIAEKDGGSNVDWSAVTDDTARDLDLSRADLMAARKKCRFV